jgi:hypothetical protein
MIMIMIIIIIIFSSNICGVISLLILYMTLIVNLRLLHPSSLVIEQGIASSFSVTSLHFDHINDHQQHIIMVDRSITFARPFTQSRPASFKGGDPAAGSPTATLLRLLPRC